MRKKLFICESIGFIFVSASGALNHFLFEWLNGNPFIGLFCPVNESVWEHLKLLFFPYLIWTAAEFLIIKKTPDFFRSKITGVMCGLIFIISFFYTYSGAFGAVNTFIDILSFFIGTAISFIISYELIKKNRTESHTGEAVSIILFAAVSILFFIFTFNPPIIPLFEDPQKLIFGI